MLNLKTQLYPKNAPERADDVNAPELFNASLDFNRGDDGGVLIVSTPGKPKDLLLHLTDDQLAELGLMIAPPVAL